ncbi:MAG TPA: CPBP family intramembrane glutamic endopeptidase [Candidatus Eisenbacteria bacterium]|nr:CPBP family intramembrane glutamic endopeptidase [Candidatus Eisenbacteria bacterium]
MTEPEPLHDAGARGPSRLFLNRERRLRSGWRLLLFFAALALVVPLVTALATTAFRAAGVPFEPREASGQPGAIVPLLVLFLAALVATLAVAAIFLRAFEGRPLATLGAPLGGGAWRSAWKSAGLGIAVGSAPALLVVGAGLALGFATTEAVFAGGASRAGAIAAAALAMLFVSVWEEVLWRGYALQQIAQGAGKWIAAIATSAIWALGHLGNDGANASGLVETGLSGVLLAWIVMRTGSIWFAFGYHVAWNVVSAVVLGLTTSGHDLSATILRTRLHGPDFLTGGDYGFEGSVVTGALDLTFLAIALLFADRLPGHRELRRYFGGAPRSAGGPDSFAAPGVASGSASDPAARSNSSAASSSIASNASGFGNRTAFPGGSGMPHSASGVPSARVKTPDGVTQGDMGQSSGPADRDLES